MAYREDQGRLARMAAFWTVTLLTLFGCNFLFELLVGIPAMREALGGFRIPVVAIDLSPAFLISAVVFVIGVVIIQKWQQKPHVADLLIDTEAELRKVTWPTLEDVVNSSIIVIVFVLFIGAFLAVADVLLNRIMSTIILGGA